MDRRQAAVENGELAEELETEAWYHAELAECLAMVGRRTHRPDAKQERLPVVLGDGACSVIFSPHCSTAYVNCVCCSAGSLMPMNQRATARERKTSPTAVAGGALEGWCGGYTDVVPP
jgi:hypothetical protein